MKEEPGWLYTFLHPVFNKLALIPNQHFPPTSDFWCFVN